MILNEEQSYAVNCNDSRILCLAGAGAGKTRTLIERICRLVKEGVPASSILALTFTNAAAFEMLSRYEEAMPGYKAPEFKTFHAFCYSVICEDKAARLAIGYAKVPSISDDAETKKVRAEAALQLGIKMSERKLAGKQTLNEQEKFNYQLIQKATLRLMKQKGVITFDYLCNSVCKLFESNDVSIQGYKDRIRYLFCDEYQDTDPIQHRFVMSFKNSNIFVVADALQAIYAFRGADSSIVKSLSKDANWTKIKLHKNYRSADVICAYANNFSKYASDDYRIELEATRPDGLVKIIQCEPSRYYEISKTALVSILNEYMKTKEETAIIARTNSEVANICEFLDTVEIRYRTRKKDEADTILKAVEDENYSITWLASYLPSDLYSQYIRLYSDSDISLDAFLHEFGWISDIRERADLLYRMKNKIDIAPEIESIQGDIPNLYVGTIHSVKGLEYSSVHVIGIDSPSFPITSEENRNLLYVAITRAKNNLYVYREERG